MHIIIVYYQKIIGPKTETQPQACDIQYYDVWIRARSAVARDAGD